MRTTGTWKLYNGDSIRTYGFASKLSQNPPIPGPTLVVNEGDSVYVHVRNISQGPPHTIHWHGMDVDQANDGTPMTSFELHHGEDSTYRFLASHAGTYIYHCHMGDVVHVQMGMYGSLIVEPVNGTKNAWTGGPPFDKEYSWLTSEIDKSWHDSIPNTDHDTTMSGNEHFTIPKFVPDFFLINGKSRQLIFPDSSIVIRSRQNEVVYLRIGNIGFLKNRILFPAALHAKVTDSDGRPFPTAFYSDTLEVCPGERYGVFFNPVTQFVDTIRVAYIDMNDHNIRDTESVPVEVKGILGVSDHSNQDEKILIYPNPSSNEEVNISIQSLVAGSFQLSIYSVVGQRIKTLDLEKNSNILSINDLKSGMYFFQFHSPLGTHVQRFIKE